MRNAVDIIKGLIMRSEMNEYKNKDRKLATQLLSQLLNKFHEVLIEDDDEAFFEDFYKLITSKKTRPYIVSNFYPEDMQEYARYGNAFGFSNDFKYEIRYLVMSILCCKDTVNDFVEKREKYDNHILRNEYEEAMKVVEYIENMYGVSYWVMECKFFLNSKLEKDSNDLLDNSPSNIFGSILGFYELKNRKSVTSDEYFYIVEKEISFARKHLNSCQDIIEFSYYCISGDSFQSNPDNIMLALSVVQLCPLIDRYIFFVKICNELMNQPKNNYLYKYVQTYIKLLKDIEDNHLIALRFVFDDENNRKKYILKSRLDNAKNYFICGNLVQARKEAVNLLKLFPNNIEAISLLVETNILIGDGKEFFKDTNLGMILHRLSSVFMLNDLRDDAMEDINKLALTCSQSTWAQCILGEIMCRCHDNQGFDYKHYKILSCLQHLDIETVINCLEKEECIKYITEELNIKNEYVQFRKTLLENNFKKASDICKIEQIKDFLFVRDKKDIIEKMGHLRPIKGSSSSIAILILKEFLSSIDIEKNYEIGFKITADLIVDNIYTSLFIPWDKLINYIDNGPSEIRKNICTPILYYVYAYYIDRTKKDDLGIVCNDFFMFENIERPSTMSIFADKYDKKLLIYFLKNICTPKIMDDSLCVFENTQERDQERVEICNLLTHIDSTNSKIYENEIREITQKLMINKELKIIDESRIHVNVDGIRDRLNNADNSGNRFDKRLNNEFQRYLFYQDERTNQWIKVIKGEEESAEKFKEFHNTSSRLLKELIFKIRDAFVSSDEYGLNGYLSLNIRHNTLDDELRSPFHKSMLYVKKDIQENQYIINDHWKRYSSDEEIKILQDCLGRFHITTEAILTKIKRDYIQIRTETKNEKGLFDYRLYDNDIGFISVYTESATTFDEFFDIVINYFWVITERNLENVKYVIKTEISQAYMDAFSALKKDVIIIKNKNVLRDLQQKINEAEIDMQNVLSHICYWFQRSNESKHNDFDLQFAFDLGLQTIKNMHPEKRFIAKKLEEVKSDKIRGVYLKNYDGIFYNILDNIYKKATPKQPNGTIIIGYSLKYIDGKVRIYIENDYDCSKNITEDIARVEEAKRLYESGEYLEKVKGEGGTGIPKICKIINYDLGAHAFIDFGYKMEENKFFIEIKF